MVADPRASGRRAPERRGHPARRHRLRPLRLLRLRAHHAEHRPPGRGRSALHELPRHPACAPRPGPRCSPAGTTTPSGCGPSPTSTAATPTCGATSPTTPPPWPRCSETRATPPSPSEVAPVQHGERVGGRPLRPVAVPARVRPVLRVPRRRDRPVLSGAGLRQPQRGAAGDPRRGLPPERGPGRPRPGLHPRHHVHPARPARSSPTWPSAPCTPPTRPRPPTSRSTGGGSTTAGTWPATGGSPASSRWASSPPTPISRRATRAWSRGTPCPRTSVGWPPACRRRSPPSSSTPTPRSAGWSTGWSSSASWTTPW